MAIRNMRHESLKSLVMLSDQYRKNQTQEAYDYNQALLDEQFDDLVNIYDIEEENVKGSNIYTPIKASVSTVESIKSKTSVVDDFRNLLFRNAKHDTRIGKRFRFADNIWIATNTATINTIMNNTLVRRCNNVLRWIDEETGLLLEEPCVFGDKISYTRTEQGTHIQVISGETVVILQYNENSKRININHRFLIGGQAYVVRMINATKRLSTYNEDSVGVIELELELVNRNESMDDIDKIIDEIEEKENAILNGNIVTPDQRDLTCFPPYDVGTFEVFNYIDNIKQDDKFTFEFFDAIRNKVYKVLDTTDNSFTIQALDYSKIPLVVQYTNTTTNEVGDFTIELRGVL